MVPKTSVAAALVALVALGASVAAQLPVSPTLLDDLHTGASSGANHGLPTGVATSGASVFFSAYTSLGAGPWFTDGTAAGTVDLAAGNPWGHWWQVKGAAALPSGDVLVAAGFVGDFGATLALLRPNGVEFLLDPNPGQITEIWGVVEWSGFAWFFADVGSATELWRSDGTVAGTVPVAGGPFVWNAHNDPVPAAGRLLYTTTIPNNALYSFDGSGQPTLLATFDGASSPSELLSLGGSAIFRAHTLAAGRELWISDGTAAGTQLLADIVPGPGDGMPVPLAAGGGRAWFTAYDPQHGRELWVTDGTTAGTTLVRDIRPGPTSTAEFVPALAYGSGLLFRVDDGVHGSELWSSDGTAAGTSLVADVNPGASGSTHTLAQLFESGGVAYFTADDGVSGSELWRTTGTSASTSMVADFNPGPASSYVRYVGSTAAGVLLSLDDGVVGQELFLTDLTAAGTTLLANLYPEQVTESSSPERALRLRDRTLFRARDAPAGSELWSTDGTQAGTGLVADLEPGVADSEPVPLVELRAGAVLAASVGAAPADLWLADGTPGVVPLGEVAPGPDVVEPGGAAVLGDPAFFLPRVGTKRQLWRTDGTAQGTARVNGSPEWDAHPSDLDTLANHVVLGDELLFAADGGTGVELWKTDGTGAGTVLVREIEPGALSSFPGAPGIPGQFGVIGDRAWFPAWTLAGRWELWSSDGTAAGTVPAGGLFTAALEEVSFVTQLDDDTLVFVASDGTHGVEPFATGGTPASTVLLADIAPGSASSSPSPPTRAGDSIWFFADGAAGLRELWRTDGTPAGTARVHDGSGVVFPPAEPVDAYAIRAVGSGEHVVFRAEHPAYGDELFYSDGTQAGTGILADSAPGPVGGAPAEVFRQGNRLLFGADDVLHGRELHSVPLAAIGAWVAEPFGFGCGARVARSGEATLGATLTVELEDASPAAPALLFYSAEATWLPLGSCELLLAVPRYLTARTTSTTGAAQVGVSVPNDASLVGEMLHFQWLVAGGGELLGAFGASDGLEVVIGP